MKKKLQRNDKRRSHNLTKIQVIRVTSIRRFEHYYRHVKRWLAENKPNEAKTRLKRVRDSWPDGYGAPWLQGHLQQAWHCNRLTPRAYR